MQATVLRINIVAPPIISITARPIEIHYVHLHKINIPHPSTHMIWVIVIMIFEYMCWNVLGYTGRADQFQQNC